MADPLRLGEPRIKTHPAELRGWMQEYMHFMSLSPQQQHPMVSDAAHLRVVASHPSVSLDPENFGIGLSATDHLRW